MILYISFHIKSSTVHIHTYTHNKIYTTLLNLNYLQKKLWKWLILIQINEVYIFDKSLSKDNMITNYFKYFEKFQLEWMIHN